MDRFFSPTPNLLGYIFFLKGITNILRKSLVEIDQVQYSVIIDSYI